MTRQARGIHGHGRSRAVRRRAALPPSAGADRRVLHPRRYRHQRLPLVRFPVAACRSASARFHQPFPTHAPPALPDGATVTAVVRDYKTIRPWIVLGDVDRFQHDSIVLWVALGAYCGILLMVVIALGFDGYTRSRVALTYAFYGITLLVSVVQKLRHRFRTGAVSGRGRSISRRW